MIEISDDLFGSMASKIEAVSEEAGEGETMAGTLPVTAADLKLIWPLFVNATLMPFTPTQKALQPQTTTMMEVKIYAEILCLDFSSIGMQAIYAIVLRNYT